MAVPKLRFPEFTDDWEQHKLGSISEIKTGPFGSTLHADDYVTDGIPIITTEHFKNGDLPTSKNGLPQVSDEDYKRLSSYVLNEGDIVFSRVGSVDINALVMPSQRHWLFSGRVLRVRPDMVNDPQFLHTVLETETIKADIRSRAVGQTMPSINTEILNETLVMMPQLRAEQEQIGQFFYSLNKTITLHQRKLEDLRILKKSMLQKMFPSEGNSVPEVRFPEFTAAWEQRKLSEVVTEIKRTDEKSDAPVMMITAENGFINQSERYSTNNAGQSLKKYILLEKGELAYNHGASKLRPYGSCFALTTEEKARIPFVYHCFSTETENSEFLSIVLNGKAVEKQLRRIVSSGARMDGLLNISFDEYTSIPVMLPRKDEQDRIAEYFKNLDHHITLHQRKCDDLQKLKKALLQQMFC